MMKTLQNAIKHDGTGSWMTSYDTLMEITSPKRTANYCLYEGPVSSIVLRGDTLTVSRSDPVPIFEWSLNYYHEPHHVYAFACKVAYIAKVGRSVWYRGEVMKMLTTIPNLLFIHNLYLLYSLLLGPDYKVEPLMPPLGSMVATVTYKGITVPLSQPIFISTQSPEERSALQLANKTYTFPNWVGTTGAG